MTPDTAPLLENARLITERWKTQRSERQARRHLERADFDALREAGFLRTVVPEDMGGLWHDAASSSRTVCEVVRLLATADPGVALVSAMHPAVVAFWFSAVDYRERESRLTFGGEKFIRRSGATIPRSHL